MTGTIRAEWTKLRTVSSTMWMLASVAVLIVGLGAAISGTVNVNLCPTPTSCHEDTTKLSLSGLWAGQLVVGLIAVLAVTSEYAHKTMTVTLSAVPRRLRAYGAKLIVVVIPVLLVSVVGVAGSLLMARQILPANGFTEANGYLALSLSHEPTLRAAVGTVLYLGLIALFSLGLATLIRDTAVAATIVFAVLFVVPMLVEIVANPEWYERLQRLSPASAGQAIQATVGVDELPIGPWQGLGVLTIWAVGAAAAGVVAFTYRDA